MPAPGWCSVAEGSEQVIRDAVKGCLARCSRGGTPLGVIGEFLGELRAKGWDREDVRKVEKTVLRILAGVVTSVASADLSADDS
jgi:hypothetical protein